MAAEKSFAGARTTVKSAAMPASQFEIREEKIMDDAPLSGMSQRCGKTGANSTTDVVWKHSRESSGSR
jgi:hypothetical protein